MGEPLHNYEEVRDFYHHAIKMLPIRHVSLSTSGVPENIIKLANDDTKYDLFFSLHSPFNEERSRLVPINKRYPLEDVLSACKYYYEKTKRKIYFEYTLIKGINDSKEDVKRLRSLTEGLLCHFNIIVLNDVAQRTLKKTTRLFAYQFVDLLKKEGLSATVRRTMGEDIEGACGQLRNKILSMNN